MYQADLKHSNTKLEEKLQRLYTLNRGERNIDLGFRAPYIKLLEAFGNPQDHLPPTIHVAGTNGKGSTIAMLKSIYEAAGYSVHTYTSPHLLRFNERIVLNGKMIEDEPLENLIDEAIVLNENRDITFFEITTAMAFAAFMRTPADLLLLEVGLGGRLDCTNILAKPYVSVINRISLDHTEFLGNTIPQIAQEKAGIIKYNTPCIAGYQDKSPLQKGQKTAVDVFVDSAGDKNAPLYCAERDWSCEPDGSSMTFTFQNQKFTLPKPNLLGDHQIQNAGCTLATVQILQSEFSVNAKAIEYGLTHAYWPGRLERIESLPAPNTIKQNWEVWYDGGHNDSAGQALGQHAQKWNANDPKPLHLIIGMKTDKNPKAFLHPILQHATSCTIVPLQGIGASLTQNSIAEWVKTEFNIEICTANDALSAIDKQLNGPEKKGRILVCGSLYLAEQLTTQKDPEKI